MVEMIYCWSEPLHNVLQDYFDHVGWEVICDSSQNNINEYIEAVIEDVVPTKTVWVYPKHKTTDQQYCVLCNDSHSPSCTTNITASLQDKLNSFNAHFEVVNTNLPEGTPTTADTTNALVNDNADVCKLFHCINIGIAAGADGIPGQTIRAYVVQVAGVFTDIFNLSLSILVVPSSTIWLPTEQIHNAIATTPHTALRRGILVRMLFVDCSTHQAHIPSLCTWFLDLMPV